MTKKERRRRSAKESSREKNFQWLVERADRHLSGKRHEINERSEFMNDREKAVPSERRNEGIRHLCVKIMTPRRGKDDAGIPRTSSTLWDVRNYMQF